MSASLRIDAASGDPPFVVGCDLPFRIQWVRADNSSSSTQLHTTVTVASSPAPAAAF
ncbi:hypothetical protein GGI15_001408 [Coemansia interrupta]|uniref:Uncharacterized protein n=1 Tax=Coemansia interrupta TaxID=1126814 RepID=A0A9W8HR94_9FUNG|nr:hypothetical protein GGI15_001408 [Coemansia interrupta]